MKNITFPDHWECPKYHFGQTVQQGRIVGMVFNEPGTPRTDELGEGWVYWILIDELKSAVEGIPESDVEPLTTEELLNEIDSQEALMKVLQNNIAALAEQIKEIAQV